MIFSSLLSIRSHPMRVRGLKLLSLYKLRRYIESHPMRVRGLKLRILPLRANCMNVAPHAGAWIETIYMGCIRKIRRVAPHAGAWIETLVNNLSMLQSLSHPMRVRGLKQPCNSPFPKR